MAPGDLTPTEAKILARLRELQGRYENFTLSIYGQGSFKKRILDWEVKVRERLESSRTMSVAVDD